MTALSIPVIAAGGVQVTDVNSRFALVQTAVNAADGALLQAATVPNSKLAKPKSILPIIVAFEALSGLSTGAIIGDFQLPPIDGASNSTYKYLGCSIGFRVCTPAADNALLIQKNGVTQQTIDINDAGLTTSEYSMLVSPVASASDDRWRVNYTKTGAPTYTSLFMVLFFSLEHVGT